MYCSEFSTLDGSSSIKMKINNNGRRIPLLIIGTWASDPVICFGAVSESNFKFVKIINNNIAAADTATLSSNNVVTLSWFAWSRINVFSPCEITAG